MQAIVINIVFYLTILLYYTFCREAYCQSSGPALLKNKCFGKTTFSVHPDYHVLNAATSRQFTGVRRSVLLYGVLKPQKPDLPLSKAYLVKLIPLLY